MTDLLRPKSSVLQTLRSLYYAIVSLSRTQESLKKEGKRKKKERKEGREEGRKKKKNRKRKEKEEKEKTSKWQQSPK